MFFQNVLKALLAGSMAVSGVYATDNDFQEKTVNSGLAYGRCYKITNQNGEVLGHQSGAWHFLQFAQNDQAIFKLCQNLGECTIPNSSYQNLQDHARFWLFDTKGNSFSKDGSFVAANSPPFGGNRRTYPAGGNYKYYVNFWGENQCGSNWLGTCPVKLHVDNLRDDKGLTVTSIKELHVSGAGDTVTVNFAEVSCPN